MIESYLTTEDLEAIGEVVGRVVDAKFTELALVLKNTNSSGSAEPDIDTCYSCSSKGVRRTRKDSGTPYYSCSNTDCGFTGREGTFIHSSWDNSNWHSRKSASDRYGRGNSNSGE